MDIRCIASNVCPKTGKCLEKDCKGEEKVVLLRKHYPDVKVGKGYGDSKSDIYLLQCAEEGLFVKNHSRESVLMQKIWQIVLTTASVYGIISIPHKERLYTWRCTS